LFVFDNIEDQENLKEFIPQPNYAPYILVTSQCREWDGKFDVLHLDVFSKRSAFQFVQKNLKSNIIYTAEECTSISNLLGYHPLALQQALSYVNNNDMTLHDYTVQIQKRKQELLSISTADLENKTVSAVLTLSIEKITEINTSAMFLNVLYVISFFDGKNIHKDLLLKFCENDILELNIILSLLRKYSIINDGTSDKALLNQTITIHSLTQYFLQRHQQLQNKL